MPGTQSQARVAPRRVSSFAMFGGILSGAAVAMYSGDWACSAIGAGVIGAVMTGLAAWMTRNPLRPRSRRMLMRVGAVALIIAAVQTILVRDALRRGAFRDAFGVDPPAALQDLYVERFYAGGPGDMMTLMRFKVDPQIVRQLVATSRSEENSSYNAYLAGTMSWKQLWDSTFAVASTRKVEWWLDAPPLAQPKLHTVGTSSVAPTGGGPIRSTRIVWDDSTGETFVLMTSG
ncbi:hypothetical protein [Humisphaera borealis]|uniref:Uncharacterized protein n=1 Tax=Humisphaera borealis TaxID=2807512 RepID=A0A7M2X1G7_9BACT|nr:hypothetical protein [Humisphaera borealis]QOV91525.1 hypothetical protein IPV69_09270 [Humisphaera borealis]